jgi:hypothetical protein
MPLGLAGFRELILRQAAGGGAFYSSFDWLDYGLIYWSTLLSLATRAVISRAPLFSQSFMSHPISTSRFIYLYVIFRYNFPK